MYLCIVKLIKSFIARLFGEKDATREELHLFFVPKETVNAFIFVAVTNKTKTIVMRFKWLDNYNFLFALYVFLRLMFAFFLGCTIGGLLRLL